MKYPEDDQPFDAGHSDDDDAWQDSFIENDFEDDFYDWEENEDDFREDDDFDSEEEWESLGRNGREDHGFDGIDQWLVDLGGES